MSVVTWSVVGMILCCCGSTVVERRVCWFQSLLEDPSHVVRSLLAFGLCKICAVYWEYIPVDVVKTLLTSPVQKHAWDASNTEVRLSVVRVRQLVFLTAVCLVYPVSLLFMATLCNRAGHIYFHAVVSSSSFFFFFSPNLSSRRLDVYHTSAHGVALVQI